MSVSLWCSFLLLVFPKLLSDLSHLGQCFNAITGDQEWLNCILWKVFRLRTRPWSYCRMPWKQQVIHYLDTGWLGMDRETDLDSKWNIVRWIMKHIDKRISSDAHDPWRLSKSRSRYSRVLRAVSVWVLTTSNNWDAQPFWASFSHVW